MRQNRAMETIRDTVNTVMHGLSEKKRITGDGTTELLKKVLTKSELAHIKCNYFKKGVLGIAVDSSAVYYKLNLKKERILQVLNEGSLGVRDINLRIGEVQGG